MKIGIVGTGAMGSVYAGLLADAGHEVWACDIWRQHIEAIRAAGLRLEGASGERLARPNAATDPADAGVCDLVIIATKARDVVAAAESARPMAGPETLVLAIQNGLGSAGKVAGVLGRERVAQGVVGGFGASMIGPGHVHHNGWEFVHLGEIGGPVTPRLERAAEAWRAAGFRVETHDDIERMVWRKLVCNVCFSGTCTLTQSTVGQVMADDGAWRVASACAAEAWRAARAKGVDLDIDDPTAHVRAFGAKIPGARPSMLLDHLARRSSEIDVINGAIPAAAREAGLEAPINETVAARVRAREARFPAG